MTGDRLRYPQVKHCMRHILSFFEEISCSVTNSATSSPVRDSPATVQKTVKRQTQIAMISNHKRTRKNGEDNKSQEQTTSKKARASASYVAMQRAVMGRGDSQNRVVTPAKNTMPTQNALVSILKRSQEKKTQMAQH